MSATTTRASLLFFIINVFLPVYCYGAHGFAAHGHFITFSLNHSRCHARRRARDRLGSARVPRGRDSSQGGHREAPARPPGGRSTQGGRSGTKPLPTSMTTPPGA